MSNKRIRFPDSLGDFRYVTGTDGNDDATNDTFVVAEDLKDGNKKLLQYDPSTGEWFPRGTVNMGGSDITNVGSLSTEQIHSKSREPSTIIYKNGSDIFAVDSDGQIDTNTDFGEVLASAVANLGDEDGDTIFVRKGLYPQTRSVEVDTKGVQIRGEGLPWARTDGVEFGTVIQATSNASGYLIDLNDQFQGLSHITLDGDYNIDRLLTIARQSGGNNRDYVIHQCGMERSSLINVQIDGAKNVWYGGLGSWNEFSSDIGIAVSNDVRDLWIEDVIFVNDNIDINFFGGTYENQKIIGNRHFATGSAILSDGTLNNCKITNNDYDGIGRDGNNATAIKLNADVQGVIGQNTVDPEDNNNNLVTEKFIELDGTSTYNELRINQNSGSENVNTAAIADAGAEYIRNNVHIRDTDPAGPAVGTRFFYRRDLSPPELRVKNKNGSVVTLATF